MTDLDLKYRPTNLEDVVGQPEAVATVRSWGKNVPRALLFTGAPGTGKTTSARIVASIVGIDTQSMDYTEVNCGAIKGAIDLVRDLEESVSASPLTGDRRMWTLDEYQTFSRSKGASEAMLKVLEECPKHVIIALCSTDPDRILPAIRSRCVKVALKALKHADLVKLVTDIAVKEGTELDSRLADKIAETAQGSARNAVKELQKVINLPPSDRLAAVGGSAVEKGASDLIAELLPFNGPPNWAGVAKCLEAVQDESAESIRLRILGIARSMMLKGGKRAELGYRTACIMDKTLYDAGGHAMLAVYCWEVVREQTGAKK